MAKLQFPVAVSDVVINAGNDIELSGTAVVPVRKDPFPAALLLSGSGPLDRDSNTPQQRLNVSPTLADALAARGVGTLRFDKRGVSASSGDFTSAGFVDEIADAESAFRALRDLDGVDPERVGIIGHSVGATIAVALAASTGHVAFVVLLGCAASTGAEVMAWQTNRIAESLPGPSWILGSIFRRSQSQQIIKLEASTSDVVRIGNKDQPAKWMREYRAHNPLTDLRVIQCPVLAITGEKDIQVSPDDIARITGSVRGPCTSFRPADLTHVLRTSTRKASIMHYARLLREPVDAELVESVVSWTVNVASPG